MKRFISTAIIFTTLLATLITGCADNADTTQTTLAPDYNTIVQEFDEYRIGYSNYMNESDVEFNYIVSDGFTPADAPCYVNFSCSEDEAYYLVSVETHKETENGVDIRRDEYYPLSDNKLYIVRHLTNDIRGAISTTSYVVIDGSLYQVNENTGTISAVTKADSLDLYLSFEEIKSLYGVDHSDS